MRDFCPIFPLPHTSWDYLVGRKISWHCRKLGPLTFCQVFLWGLRKKETLWLQLPLQGPSNSGEILDSVLQYTWIFLCTKWQKFAAGLTQNPEPSGFGTYLLLLTSKDFHFSQVPKVNSVNIDSRKSISNLTLRKDLNDNGLDANCTCWHR